MMKKFLAATSLALTALASQVSYAIPYTVIDSYDPKARFFSYDLPLNYTHNIVDDGFKLGDTILSATLTLDFTNDWVDLKFDFLGRTLENVTAWYGGTSWYLGEVDNGAYALAIADLALLANGSLDVTLRTARGNTGAWLDSSTLTVIVDSAAVPEPGPLALLGLGLTGLAAARRSKR